MSSGVKRKIVAELIRQNNSEVIGIAETKIKEMSASHKRQLGTGGPYEWIIKKGNGHQEELC